MENKDIVLMLRTEAEDIRKTLVNMPPVVCPHLLCEECARLKSEQDLNRALLEQRLMDKENLALTIERSVTDGESV